LPKPQCLKAPVSLRTHADAFGRWALGQLVPGPPSPDYNHSVLEHFRPCRDATFQEHQSSHDRDMFVVPRVQYIHATRKQTRKETAVMNSQLSQSSCSIRIIIAERPRRSTSRIHTPPATNMLNRGGGYARTKKKCKGAALNRNAAQNINIWARGMYPWGPVLNLTGCAPKWQVHKTGVWLTSD